MSWNTLNNSELQACRKLLMLDVSEAAELIGKVSPRTWQYWESGRSKVPPDVDSEIYLLIGMRNELVGELTEKQYNMEQEDENATLTLNYYHTFEQYAADYPGKNQVCWRIHQAAVAFVFSEGGNVELS